AITALVDRPAGKKARADAGRVAVPVLDCLPAGLFPNRISHDDPAAASCPGAISTYAEPATRVHIALPDGWGDAGAIGAARPRVAVADFIRAAVRGNVLRAERAVPRQSSRRAARTCPGKCLVAGVCVDSTKYAGGRHFCSEPGTHASSR